jgi:hypothetical protein
LATLAGLLASVHIVDSMQQLRSTTDAPAAALSICCGAMPGASLSQSQIAAAIDLRPDLRMSID